jgi:partner of Y14 and mago protein
MSRQTPGTPQSSKSGIRTAEDGASFIPSSKRADGTTRKEIRVRPGYRPPEDVETYKNRSAEAWKNRGTSGIPGAEPVPQISDNNPAKSKNAKRREAARRKVAEDSIEATEHEVTSAMEKTKLSEHPDQHTEAWHDPSRLTTNESQTEEAAADQQKKIRNLLKKLRAVQEMREKRAAGEKLSPDQVMKIGKEGELLRDLKKLGYDGPELQAEATDPEDKSRSSANVAG